VEETRVPGENHRTVEINYEPGKCAIYDQLSFIYRLKLYALTINGKNEAVL
jgi:hypothetical protein